MIVVRAGVYGMCFGVRDALAAVRGERDPARTAVWGELVHNPLVLAELAGRGFTVIGENDRAELPAADRVVVTAHGVSDRDRRRLAGAGKTVVDTTCPLVGRAHRAATELRDAGFHVVVIGKPGHVEVRGLTGDLDAFDVVECVADVRSLGHPRIGVLCQTTVESERALQVLRALRAANPSSEVRFVDTICEPTKQRIRAVIELAGRVDAVVVVGGRNSNNTARLVALAAAQGTPALRVERADELDPARFAGVRTVGVTAGTSTLPETIDAVCAALARIDPPAVTGAARRAPAAARGSRRPPRAGSPRSRRPAPGR